MGKKQVSVLMLDALYNYVYILEETHGHVHVTVVMGRREKERERERDLTYIYIVSSDWLSTLGFAAKIVVPKTVDSRFPNGN